MTTATKTIPAVRGMKGSGGLIYTTLYLAGMVLLFIGERTVLESRGVRLGLGAVAGALLLAGVVGRALRRGRVGQPARSVEGRILACYLVGLAAALLYFVQADFVMEKLRPIFGEARSAERFGVALAALWPTIWLCSMLPLLFIEISYSAMDISKTLELSRIRRSAGSALVLAMTIALVFAANFIFSEFNKKLDLSYFKTTQASESSRKMVKNLSEPFRVTLFFPGANEVREQVLSYFADLKKESRQLEVKSVDHVMEPELAKELGVPDNGTIVLSRKKQHEQINVGTKLQRAKTTLKKLDSEFQASFRKLAQVQRVAYLTVGHEERTNEERDKGVRGSSIRDMRTLLQRMNYEIKELGIGQGLGQEVPGDATLIIVAGPRKDFLPAELAALKKYLRDGGHLLLFLDPEAGLDMAGLLGPFGLKFTPTRLANDRFHVRLTSTPADRHVLFTQRFSAHPSVTTLTRNASQLATVMAGAGYLEEVPPTEAATAGRKPQVQFTLHSMPFTWNDLNVNMAFDPPAEQRKIYELGAVVSAPSGKPAPPGPAGKKSEPPELRLVVVADSDIISDQLFRNPGNGYLFVDAVKWLGGEEEYIGETASEEDVRIMHSRAEDAKWFYATIFGVPSLVLAAGLFYTTRRRRRP